MLSEIPIFARSGSIIPRWPVSGNDVIGRASRQYDHLEFTMIPGSETSGSVDVYVVLLTFILHLALMSILSLERIPTDTRMTARRMHTFRTTVCLDHCELQEGRIENDSNDLNLKESS